MNKLPMVRRVQVISALVEGCSIRSTVRMTGVAKNTIVKLLVDVGRACAAYHDHTVRNLTCQRIQCDEIWSFVGCKEKNIPDERSCDPYIGNVWTWTALVADPTIIIAWLVGGWETGFSEL